MNTERPTAAGPEALGKEEVWLEAADGRRWSIKTNCALGRSPTNEVVLEGGRISRRHALIYTHSSQIYWLVDLSSSNGTYLNRERVVQPMLLRDGDTVEIGEYQLKFRHPLPLPTSANLGPPTVKMTDCWLLLADVLDATMIMQKSPKASLPQVMGRWLEGSKEIVQRHGGCVNKFLGNGFLAYWRHSEEATLEVAKACAELVELQVKAEPPFRFVVHWGQVAITAANVPGEEILMGQEINRAFRMEKLAGNEGQSNLMSSPAHGLLKPHIDTFELGSFTLLGFRQPEMFFIL